MYINFKNHTTYSLCKGAIKINELIEKAKEYKMPAIGIMDINNLFWSFRIFFNLQKTQYSQFLDAN